jgi:hemerythrin superfamily protein
LRVARLFAQFNKLKDVGADEDKARVVATICRELSVHAQIEEEIFYPAVRKVIEDDDLMDEAWVEQAGAKELIAQLREANPDDDLYDAKVTVLAEQIDHHVQEEEKDMFPQARRSELDTAALGAQMRARKAELLSPARATPGGESSWDSAEPRDDRKKSPRNAKKKRPRT